MRLARLVNLGLVAAGAVAALPTLRRRHAWESSNRGAFLVLDFDDALAVGTRAGLPLGDFLCRARDHGATHVGLPEVTLDRLLHVGRLKLAVPHTPEVLASPLEPAPIGPWHFFSSAEPRLLDYLAAELAARLPTSAPQRLADTATGASLLAVAGHLPTLAELGLGFDPEAASLIRAAGLAPAPRPVPVPWPEDHLVERTLDQAAQQGSGLVIFDGDLILGHEMHLDATVGALLRHRLTFAYFAETRHQKGDWFVAKRLAPHGLVTLAHCLTPAAMVPEDFHSAAHRWGMLASMRGIRLCYVNVFRRIHATEPLECLHYLEHIREELEGLGLTLVNPVEASPVPARAAETAAPNPGTPVLAAPGRATLALAGLAAAGTVALVASETLDLPQPAAVGVTALAAAACAVLPYLDRPRSRLEAAYPPSYAPKLLALAAAAAAPAAAALSQSLPEAALLQAGTAASLAALTTGQDYQQRIEAFQALNLDWALPLAALVTKRGPKAAAAACLPALTWLAVGRATPDLLGQLDLDLPAGHTHHLSAAQRLLGDARLALGPRPGRKWAGLALAAVAVAGLLRRSSPRADRGWAVGAEALAVAAGCLMLAAFRRPERPLAVTVSGVGRSWAAWGAVAGAVLLLAAPNSPIRHEAA